MNTQVPFTNNFTDVSTDAAFQFQFFCERCGTGYTSTEKSNTVGKLGDKATKSLGGMFGGKLSKVASSMDAALDNVAETKTHDKAFTAAVDEVGRRFHRCNVCRDWVCEDQCWDDEYNLCTRCAAEQRQQGAGQQAQTPSMTPPPQFAEAAQRVAEAFTGAVAQARTATTCPSCGTGYTAGAKFCPNCGQTLSIAPKCSSCGTESPAGTKFCPECGQSLASG